ncbi:MAG: hypothetical protein K0R03_272 [Moraxellaceae bacterium]|jgi:CHAD domain-containing protein|nr:hypothetical protein [Moraxellaceae bacterium]MDF3029714.1 hypothetical protein [Moraxellaceae bacterium]
MRPKHFRQQLAARQAALAASLGNLVHAPAPKTLHRLRVDLRRLRALLRPLAGRRAFAPLYRDAGRVLEASGPLRDLEVLADELDAHGLARTALPRRKRFQAGLEELLAGKALQHLDDHCRPRPEPAPLIALPDREALAKRCRKAVSRDLERLRRRLDQPDPDLHRLRLDIKSLRYQLLEQEVDGIGKELKLLARLQDRLGDWHDRTLWLGLAQQEDDLQPCVKRWRAEQAELARWLPDLVARLRLLLGTA